MFPALPEIKVLLAVGVTDMRKSINGLSILVEEQLALDPLSAISLLSATVSVTLSKFFTGIETVSVSGKSGWRKTGFAGPSRQMMFLISMAGS